MTDAAPTALDWIPAPKPETFGTRLRMVRAEHDQTIEEIVNLCNLGLDKPVFNSATWSSWENGARPRDMADVVERIHRATAVNRNWLMWGSTSARMYAPDLVGLPSMLDNRFRSTKDSPILTIVTTDD